MNHPCCENACFLHKHYVSLVRKEFPSKPLGLIEKEKDMLPPIDDEAHGVFIIDVGQDD